MHVTKEQWIEKINDALLNNSPESFYNYIIDNSDYDGGHLEDIENNIRSSLKTLGILLLRLIEKNVFTVDEVADTIKLGRLL